MKVGKSRQEILEMLETVYGESAMKRRTVYKWVDRFKEGQESIHDNMQEGCPSKSRVGENIHVHDLVMSYCRITTRIITDKLGITKGSVQTILKEDLNVYDLKCGQKRTGS
jgi:transposase